MTAVTVTGPARPAAAAPSGPLAGTGALLTLALRRDRIILPVWCYAYLATTFGSAFSGKSLYATAAARTQFGSGLAKDPALVAMYGPPFDLTSLGALDTWKIAGLGAAITGLLGLLTVVRHSRAEEAAGRAELVGAAVVGRYALLSAAVATGLIAGAGVGLLAGVGLIAGGLPVGASLLFGATLTATTWVFAGVAAVTAQLTETSRAASGLAATVLAATYVLRAIGDSAGTGGAGWLSWLSPIAWSQRVHPFSDPRPGLLLFAVAATAVLVGAGFALVGRRDIGAGLLPSRPGRPAAAVTLTGPWALAWRQHRGLLVGWAAGFAIGGLALGSVANGVGGLVGSSPQAASIIAQLGGHQSLTDAYLAAVGGLFGPVASIFAVQAVLRARGEETGGLAEPLLAGPVGRVRWLTGHVVVAAAGTALLLAIGGAGMGLTFGAATHDLGGRLPELTGALVAQLPAALVLTAVAVALVGLVPRAAAAAWGAIAVGVLLGEFGPAFDLPQWVLDISPFTHSPHVPGGTVTAAPLFWLCLVAVVVTAAGLAGFRRRDLG